MAAPHLPFPPSNLKKNHKTKPRENPVEQKACCSNDWAWVRTLFTYRRTTHPFPPPSLLISLSLSLALCFSLLTHKYARILS